MLKMVFLLPRRKDLTRDQFLEFWREKHVHLVKALPALRKCVFSEVVAAPGGELPYDALVELYYDDINSVRSSVRSPEAQACEESLVHFVDLPRWQVVLTTEGEPD